MNKNAFDINKIRIASPCSVPWETMQGDDRARHCDSCKLNVYNISTLTKTEVENLITNREGRLCLRLYKRADGTVLTKDCPVGFRAYRKRVARFAGAALAAFLGLFSVSYGQKDEKKSVDASKVKIIKTENQTQQSILYGVITDSAGAIIVNAEIKLFKKGEKNPLKTVSDDAGNYSFASLSEGVYDLEINYPAFTKLKIKNLKIAAREKNLLDIILQPSGVEVVVGIFVEESLIDTTKTSVTTIISRDKIEKLPH